MFGGLIASIIGTGGSVDILAVTDGEAAYPRSVPADRLAARRRAEQESAVVELGVAPQQIVRLGLPDGHVARYEDELVGEIAALLFARDIDLLVAPWKHDHHTDHEACGRAVERASDGAGRRTTTAFGLFWSLLRGDPPPGLTLAALRLAPPESRSKRRAIDRHRSQVSTLVDAQPVIGVPELEIAHARCEHYLVPVR